MDHRLQLGLALPSCNHGGFDLNGYGFEPKGELGSDPLSHSLGPCLSSESTTTDCNLIKKRSFDEAFEVRTLPLFMNWNNQPNEEDDDCKDLDKNSSTTNNDGDDDEGIVGWPPIKSWRKKVCSPNTGGLTRKNVYRSRSGGGGGSSCGSGLVSLAGASTKSTYVKVKMEGMAIGRKVDLSLHHSYQTLTHTLVGMFGKDHEEDMKCYELTYQDIEGDWLLAGDVPWSSFIQSAQQLKLIRGSG